MRQVVAVLRASDGTIMRHDLWAHGPKRVGGTSQSVLFTAHDNAFSGFEITHTASVAGKRASAFFGFMASGSGPQLKPGVYVLAGPRAATGLPPDLTDDAYTGDKRAPVRQSDARSTRAGADPARRRACAAARSGNRRASCRHPPRRIERRKRQRLIRLEIEQHIVVQFIEPLLRDSPIPARRRAEGPARRADSNLRAENAILFQALSRSVGCQRKLEHMVDRRAYAGRAAEKQIRWS